MSGLSPRIRLPDKVLMSPSLNTGSRPRHVSRISGWHQDVSPLHNPDCRESQLVEPPSTCDRRPHTAHCYVGRTARPSGSWCWSPLEHRGSGRRRARRCCSPGSRGRWGRPASWSGDPRSRMILSMVTRETRGTRTPGPGSPSVHRRRKQKTRDPPPPAASTPATRAEK